MMMITIIITTTIIITIIIIIIIILIYISTISTNVQTDQVVKRKNERERLNQALVLIILVG